MIPAYPSLAWNLNEVRLGLDSISGKKMAKFVFITVEDIHAPHRNQLGLALQHTIGLSLRAHGEFVLHRAIGPDPLSLTFERCMKLLHQTPRLLFSTDGEISDQGRFKALLTGYIEDPLSWLFMRTLCRGLSSAKDTVGTRQPRATTPFAHE